MPEARLDDVYGAGLAPVADGWFVVNIRDAAWWSPDMSEGLTSWGSVCLFEHPQQGFQQLGIRLKVLEPGEPNALYHSESQQEAFLVLSGECTLIVESEERLLRQWDFFHSPAGTEHVFVGAGDGPCVLLLVGARTQDEQLLYPVSELAARHGASAAAETSDPDEAYADARWAPPRPGRPSSWDRLPWS